MRLGVQKNYNPLNRKAVAEILGISERTLVRWESSGCNFSTGRIGWIHVYDEDEVQSLLEYAGGKVSKKKVVGWMKKRALRPYIKL